MTSLQAGLEPRILVGASLGILQAPVRERARLCYNKEGVRSLSRTIILDLSPGARLRLSATHNCQVISTLILRLLIIFLDTRDVASGDCVTF